jgi:two-component system, LuxR family, response regulator FixJ
VSTLPMVHVVDDSAEMRGSLELLLKSVALDTQTYATADEFLVRFGHAPDRSAVLLLDVRMPGMSGMALLERLRAEHPLLPVIMMTGHGDIDMAVRAMKLGAMDFITKPFGSQALLDRIQEVVRRGPEFAAPEPGAEEAAARLAALTPREREIFDRIVCGTSNKVIALDFGISIRTVESHRANIMEKLKARTLVDLVLISVRLKTAREPRA